MLVLLWSFNPVWVLVETSTNILKFRSDNDDWFPPRRCFFGNSRGGCTVVVEYWMRLKATQSLERLALERLVVSCILYLVSCRFHLFHHIIRTVFFVFDTVP